MQTMPELRKSGWGDMTKDEFRQTMQGASVSTINAEWDSVDFTDQDYANYITELNNYNTAWAAVIE
jgi:hypothetical protein